MDGPVLISQKGETVTFCSGARVAQSDGCGCSQNQVQLQLNSKENQVAKDKIQSKQRRSRMKDPKKPVL